LNVVSEFNSNLTKLSPYLNTNLILQLVPINIDNLKIINIRRNVMLFSHVNYVEFFEVF
jgi:hypothetical protein